MFQFFTSFFNVSAAVNVAEASTTGLSGLWQSIVEIFSKIPLFWIERGMIAFSICIIPTFWIMRHISFTKGMVEWVYGDMEDAAFDKFCALSVAFGFVIGSYWAMRGFKDSLFADLVGFKDWQPICKMISLGVVFASSLIFSKVVYLFKRHRLFYAVCYFYGGLFILYAFAYKLNLPELKLFLELN